MSKRPYLVLPNSECVPLDGDYRVEEYFGQWWVLGHHQAIGCDSPTHAEATLARVRAEHDAHALAAEALADLPLEYGLRSIRP